MPWQKYLSTLFKNGTNLEWWHNTGFPFLFRRAANSLVYNPWYRFTYGGRVDIMNEDWDNLIILDAARYDYFASQNMLQGTLESRISPGSTSGDFQQNAFNDTYLDTVYVSANPHVSRFSNEKFHDLVSVWDGEDWDSELKTVPPGKMVQATLEAAERYPDKRFIVHFMQPHQPYLGKWARDELGSMTGNEAAKQIAEGEDVDLGDLPNAIRLMASGQIDPEKVKRAYRENLDLVLDHTERLLNSLEGKSVITADHGEMFGEYAIPFPIRVYGPSVLV